MTAAAELLLDVELSLLLELEALAAELLDEEELLTVHCGPDELEDEALDELEEEEEPDEVESVQVPWAY